MMKKNVASSLLTIIPALILTVLFLGNLRPAAAIGASTTGSPVVTFETHYDSGGLDSGRAIAVDNQGNIIIGATVYPTSSSLPQTLILKYDPFGTLVISKTIAGTSGLIYTSGVVVDDAGDIYIGGYTTSSDFPLVNAWQDNLQGPNDAFIAKLSGADGAIIFSTLIGGTRSETSGDIALTAAGDIVLVGSTSSVNFPTVNPVQANLAIDTCLCYDAFVAKFSAAGDQLLFSTYLGGTEDDYGRGVAVDNAGNILFTGYTESPDLPVLNAAQSALGGETDGFVAKIAGISHTLNYATYLGGDDDDWGFGLDVDNAGNAYITGKTRSTDFPTTSGAYEESFSAGGINNCGIPGFEPIRNCDEIFVTKVTPTGSSLAYSTYVAGGAKDDWGSRIVVDSANQAHLVGYSGYQPSTGTGNDIVTIGINAAGSDLLYTVSKFSGVANQGHDIDLDEYGTLYVTAADNVPADVYLAKIEGAAAAGTPPVTITPQPNDDLSLGWQPIYGAVDYDIFRSTEPNAALGTPYATTSQQTIVDSNVMGNGNNYFYQVKAMDGSGNPMASYQESGFFSFAINN